MSEREELLLKVEKKNYLEYLLSTTEFTEIFLRDYLSNSLNELVYREGSSEGTMKAIDARKSLNDYIYDILDTGKQAEQKLKG